MKKFFRAGTRLFLLLAALLALTVGWTAIPRSDEGIRAVADAFVLPEQWDLIQDQVVPPSLICWEFSTSCPAVRRLWESKQPLPFAELLRIVESSGYEINHVETPFLKDYSDVCGNICSIDANFSGDKNYTITIYYEGHQNLDVPRISLSVNVG
ncbi:hypothetical protein CPHO_02105 [Corynebacterium phocae]|uniref:Uncharacterized protein n=1 Tax=Corynebacterium phocae TaxID=161895 RepID=A0A1L7D184_9CORY|nr:hypothetical protein [Corynebacterium phocae]APT91899.1 hypothetical protein CPHO_02105 [Corynebacterium phocae]KAA8727400.1 hypothetical protein F4V58_01640 [Corynebacterium phocae]